MIVTSSLTWHISLIRCHIIFQHLLVMEIRLNSYRYLKKNFIIFVNCSKFSNPKFYSILSNSIYLALSQRNPSFLNSKIRQTNTKMDFHFEWKFHTHDCVTLDIKWYSILKWILSCYSFFFVKFSFYPCVYWMFVMILKINIIDIVMDSHTLFCSTIPLPILLAETKNNNNYGFGNSSKILSFFCTHGKKMQYFLSLDLKSPSM